MDSNGEIDVFISYTHLDNKTLSKEQKEKEGWISRFHYALNTLLGEKLGRKPIIWRDDILQGNDEFSEEIESKIQKAKVLLTIISPRYLESEWCEKELKYFIKAAETGGGLHVGNKSRIFKVVKTYVPHKEHPDEIRGLNGYEFFQLDEKERPHEFILEKGSPSYYKFREKLDDMAWDIHKFLKEVDKQRETGEEPPLSPPEKTVYLAETTFDLQEERENIQRDLKQKGYTILPDRQLPLLLRDGNFKESVLKDLERCKLSIHLVGAMYGAVPEGEERSIIDLQNELVMEQCKNNQLKQLIWIPPDLEKSKIDKRQEKYIYNLRDDAPQDEGIELLEYGLEDFKTIIRDTLEKIKNPTKESTTTGSPYVYLVYDKKDTKNIKDVDNCLFNEGFEVRHPLSEGSAAEYRKIHKDRLFLCDAMMIYYDCANEYWLQTKMDDIRKVRGYGRKKPLKTSVFITGEKTEHKKAFRTNDAEVIKEYNPSFCEVLNKVIDQIREGSGGSL